MDGIILINKQKGCTSHDVVYKAKIIFGEKVGHTGTLDPMATGVLPLLIGKGTLCSKYLINHDKIYKVKLELGKKTTTADSEGEIIEKKQVNNTIFDKTYIVETLNSFLGKQKQIPPIYSAIKVNGKKLYEYARQGREVKIEPRDIEIYKIKLLNIDSSSKQIDFEVNCSKGTYIRSLCEDIATKLGTVGFMKELQREKVGDFCLEESITINQLQEGFNDKNFMEEKFISIEKIFKNQESIILDDRKLKHFLNGVKISYNKNDGVYRIYNNQNFIGTGIISGNLLKRDIVVCKMTNNML